MGEAILVVRQVPIKTPDPTIYLQVQDFESLTFRLTNNHDKDVTVFYELDNAEPVANTIVISANSFEDVTLPNLNSNQNYNFYAYAIEEGQRASDILLEMTSTLKYTTQPPSITNVSADTDSVTFTLTNNDGSNATVYYEIDNAVPNANSISLIDGESYVDTLTGLNDETPYILYARAQASNENMSETVNESFTTESAASIETNGLVVWLDAETPGSSTWTDLSGNGNHMPKNGGVSTATIDGVTAFNLNSNGKYFYNGSMSGTQPSNNATMEAWIYPATSELTSGDRGTIMLFRGNKGLYHSWNKSNRELSNYWYAKSPPGYHETNTPMTRGNWYYTAAVWDGSIGQLRQWVNGNKTTVNTSGSGTTGNDLNIGRESSGRQFSGGIAIIRIYNTALSDAKILEHYNKEKSRFGL